LVLLKPNSVSRFCQDGGYLSRRRFAAALKLPTRSFLRRNLFGIAPGRVCLACCVTTAAGELLPHRFTPYSAKGGAGLFSVALVLFKQFLTV